MPRREVEKRLSVEWMAKHYPDGGYWLNYPLITAELTKAYGQQAFVWARRADALAVTKNELHLIEFKVWKPSDGLDKLPTYASLIPHIAELSLYRSYPVKMILVTPRPNPALEESCRLNNITLIEVHNAWIDEVVAGIEHLWTKEGRDAMAEKKRLRTWLGLD